MGNYCSCRFCSDNTKSDASTSTDIDLYNDKSLYKSKRKKYKLQTIPENNQI